MARIRAALVSFAAACAVLALAAGSAYATENLPAYGKCQPQAGGKYLNPGCTKLGKSAEKQKYEWHPLAAAVPFGQGKEHNTGKLVLEAASGVQITCTAQYATGEYGPANEVKNVVMEFLGCKGGGAGCNTEGRPAEEVLTRRLHGEPGVVQKELKEEKNIDGTDLVAEDGENVAEFSCGPEPITVRGGIVARAQADSTGGTTGEYTNKMAKKYEVEYVSGPNGVQSPREWTPDGGGISHTNHEPVVEHLEASEFGPVEEASLSFTALQESLPNTPANAVELRQCESNIVC